MKYRALSIITICLCLFPNTTTAVTNGFPTKPTNSLVRVGICNGTLISPKFVLTAAHCVFDTPVNLVTLRKMDGTYIRNKERVIVHPEYTPWNDLGVKRNDIALIELSSQVKANFPPLALGYDSKIATISGWGKREDGSYPRSPFTIKNIPILPTYNQSYWENHLEYLRSDDLSQNFEDTFFTGDYLALQVVQGRSACRGDSGSAVFGEYGEIIGLVSHGQNDCLNQNLFFITDLIQYQGWIHQYIGDAQ